MTTIYDWITVAIFAGLIVLFMQRSVGEVSDHDPFWPYIAAGIACACINYLGNHGYDAAAILAGVALIAFIFTFLKPFGRPKV